MSTPFLPVTCRCTQCQRLFIEWFHASECEGKTKHWTPKLRCNACFADKSGKDQAAVIAGMFDKRNLDMRERFPDADTKHLCTVHAELFKNEERYRTVYKSDDTFSQHTEE